MRMLILTDYKATFYSSTKNAKALCTLNTNGIRKNFVDRGYQVEVSNFSNIDLHKDYKDVFVIYTSSEDYGLKYKSYIEDVILFLKERGAVVIPDYPFLRAHHNKSFMEMMRYKLFPEQAKLLNTRIYGTWEDLKADDLPDRKYVIKSAFGAGSKYVKSANNKRELLKIAKKISCSRDLENVASEYRRRIFWKDYQGSSLNRNKFIVQNFIDNLKGDFKVLKYGKRFYALYRQNRPNDFRASGGGRLNFTLPDSTNESELFDFAKKISDEIGTPLCSMDVAWDGKNYLLLEFQCLCFGPYTAEHSDHYNVFENEKWKKVYEVCCVEEILSEAVHHYLQSLRK